MSARGGPGLWREAVVVDGGGLADYRWVGLRFPDVGVVGPFAVDVSPGVVVVGFGPADHAVEIVAWRDDPVVGNPEDATVLATLEDWPGAESSNATNPPALVVRAGAADTSIEVLDRADFDARMSSLIPPDQTDAEETEAPDASDHDDGG